MIRAIRSMEEEEKIKALVNSFLLFKNFFLNFLKNSKEKLNKKNYKMKLWKQIKEQFLLNKKELLKKEMKKKKSSSIT